MFDVSGKVVLITGAAGGIGRGLCDAFLDWNATVLALDRDAGVLTGMDARLKTAAVDKPPIDVAASAIDCAIRDASSRLLKNPLPRRGRIGFDLR